MKKKSFLGLVGIIILSLAIVGVGCGKSDDNNSDGNKSDGEKVTVTIGKVPYIQEWVPAFIIKNVAEELGYNTEIVEADIGFIFQGLAQGDINIYPDFWLPTLHKTYMDKYEGKIEIAGAVYKKAPVGWVVPSYVDIKSIDELKGREDEFNGRIIGLEPSAGMMLVSEETIDTYELDEYELLEGSTPAMLAEADKAIKNNEPIVFLSWRPHTMWLNYDIKFLEDPKGVWSLDDCNIGVSNDLKEKAPDLHQFLGKFEMPIDEVEKMLGEIEKEEKDVDILAKGWIEENRTLVDEMLGK